jgi:hypothetical protein
VPRDKLRQDVNETAFRTVQAATGQRPHPKPAGQGEPNPVAVERGRLGGEKGGAARAKKLGAKRRKQIARKAAKTRWRGREE